MRTEFRFLSEQDMVEAGVRDAPRSVDVADEIFRLLNAGDYLMGGPNGSSHGLGLQFPRSSPFPNMPLAGPDRRFVTMPAYLGGRFDVCGNKWYGSNPANVAAGLPRSVLTLMLNDRDTGEPLALMAANALSATRTGAVPAVAIRYLMAAPPRRLAVIGCGVINAAVVAAIRSQTNVAEVVCHDLERAKAEAFSRELEAESGIPATVADTVELAVRDADLVTVAASRAAPLRVRGAWFAQDALILVSGPLNADDALWTGSRVVYDFIPLHEAYVSEARASGDLEAAYAATIGGPLYALIDDGTIAPLADSEDLGSVMADGARASRGRTIFISSGMAVFDVGWGFDLLGTAIREQLGTPLEFWGTPGTA